MVGKLLNAEGAEEKKGEWIKIFKDNVPHPAASDLLCWPQKEYKSAEEIVDAGLAHKPLLT